MVDNRNTMKKNQPELLVDFNGNAVQHAWMLGGKTITVADGNTFVCESTLMRICNSGSAVARLTLQGADYASLPSKTNGQSDEGLPILPGTVEIFGVYHEGQVYKVAGGDVDVTFVFDRRITME